jgi:ABC-type polysaccharide/polyol phosphate export permease
VKIQEAVFSTQLARDMLPFPVAVGIGFLAYSRIGPAILRASDLFSKQSPSAPESPPK